MELHSATEPSADADRAVRILGLSFPDLDRRAARSGGGGVRHELYVATFFK